MAWHGMAWHGMARQGMAWRERVVAVEVAAAKGRCSGASERLGQALRWAGFGGPACGRTALRSSARGLRRALIGVLPAVALRTGTASQRWMRACGAPPPILRSSPPLKAQRSACPIHSPIQVGSSGKHPWTRRAEGRRRVCPRPNRSQPRFSPRAPPLVLPGGGLAAVGLLERRRPTSKERPARRRRASTTDSPDLFEVRPQGARR